MLFGELEVAVEEGVGVVVGRQQREELRADDGDAAEGEWGEG